jgi:hypothetical protein
VRKFIPIILRIIGVVLILVGLVAAYYGPLEIFVFYLFSEGGRFYYEGFGVGSFWFAALVVQNIGYYIIAALFIPVGIGHVKLRRWALTLNQLYIWFWLVAGFLLYLNFLTLIPSILKLELSRDVLFLQLTTFGIDSLIALVLLPGLALWFYRSEGVKSVFEEHDSNRYWTERYPFPLLALLLLYVIMIIVLHVAIFFQSLFPMFGSFMLGRKSVSIIALCILIMGILMYGTIGRKKWAWSGSTTTLILLTISSGMSFSRFSFYDILLMMNLPAYEMGFLNKMTPLHDFHLVGLITPPLLIALGLIIYSKRYFGTSDNDDEIVPANP